MYSIHYFRGIILKVFISWSGKKSHAVAEALHEWLPTVINSVEPWISSEGLRAGLKWNQQLEKELNGTSFGIIVATPRNQDAQWLNFEAGALSKKVGGAESRVAPLLIDFNKVTDLIGPLASYQATMPTREGFHDLVASINEALGDDSRSVELLNRGFAVCWPALEAKLLEVDHIHANETEPVSPDKRIAPRSPEDMLSEILETMRDMNRSDTRLKNVLSAREQNSADRPLRTKSRMVHSRTNEIVELFNSEGLQIHRLFRAADGTTHIELTTAISVDEEERLFGLLSDGQLTTGKVRFRYRDSPVDLDPLIRTQL